MGSAPQNPSFQLQAWQDHITGGDFPDWHGYTLGGVNHKIITLFVDPQAKREHVEALKKRVSRTHPANTVDVFRVPRFQRTQTTAPPLPAPSASSSSAVPFLPSPAQVRPGDQITASAGECGTETIGTIAGFLQGASGVWILSNNHVLLPGPFCSHVIVRSASDKELSNDVLPVQIQRLGNHVDAAIAKVNLDPEQIEVIYPGITLTTAQPPPSPPPSSSIIAKLGAQTRITRGHFVGMFTGEIGDNQGATHEFVDQFLIKSVEGGPFLKRGDSGSLAIVDGRPLGLLFANPRCKADDPACGGENPLLFGLANPFADVISAVNAVSGDQFTLKLPRSSG